MCIPGQKNLSLNSSNTLSWPKWPIWLWQPAMAFCLCESGRISWILALSLLLTWEFLYRMPCFNLNCFITLRKALRSELMSCLILSVSKVLFWIAWIIWHIAGSFNWAWLHSSEVMPGGMLSFDNTPTAWALWQRFLFCHVVPALPHSQHALTGRKC